ncbi:MAG TPA: 6,7-dimethyl-8-ribityllumazine synthase [bacterium]|jgi:6,7-dimethyl-8-ribityllumazine synthase|nr:6,7-dimethyl-8-ribityllumazine synthase [bacterium]
MAVKIIEAKPEGAKFKIAIVVSRFNDLIGQQLLKGALATLTAYGVKEEHIEAAWVPGAWEIPVAAAKYAKSENFNGIITLGAVIQGETSHHEYIANEVAASLGRITSETGIPVAFGLLTTASLDQALARAGETSDNKGAEAALHLLETLTVLHQIR